MNTTPIDVYITGVWPGSFGNTYSFATANTVRLTMNEPSKIERHIDLYIKPLNDVYIKRDSPRTAMARMLILGTTADVAANNTSRTTRTSNSSPTQ